MSAPRIQILVQNILPGLPNLNSELPQRERLAVSVEANVRWSMQQILDAPEGQNAVKKGAKLLGAIYEIASGRSQTRNARCFQSLLFLQAILTLCFSLLN